MGPTSPPNEVGPLPTTHSYKRIGKSMRRTDSLFSAFPATNSAAKNQAPMPNLVRRCTCDSSVPYQPNKCQVHTCGSVSTDASSCSTHNHCCTSWCTNPCLRKPDTVDLLPCLMEVGGHACTKCHRCCWCHDTTPALLALHRACWQGNFGNLHDTGLICRSLFDGFRSHKDCQCEMVPKPPC